MAIERTFSIVKPDAVAKHGIGKVLARIGIILMVLRNRKN